MHIEYVEVECVQSSADLTAVPVSSTTNPLITRQYGMFVIYVKFNYKSIYKGTHNNSGTFSPCTQVGYSRVPWPNGVSWKVRARSLHLTRLHCFKV